MKTQQLFTTFQYLSSNKILIKQSSKYCRLFSYENHNLMKDLGAKTVHR